MIYLLKWLNIDIPVFRSSQPVIDDVCFRVILIVRQSAAMVHQHCTVSGRLEL
jgi:hypothetical protein